MDSGVTVFSDEAAKVTEKSGGLVVDPGKKVVPPPTPFLLGDGVTPIPASVVKKIQALEYVEFSELMPDNVQLLGRLETTDKAASSANVSKGRLRQVSSVSTWAQCFFIFAAILVEKHPTKFQELMAYGRFILKEAARHGGEGWRVYDTMFRQRVAAKKETLWDVVNGTMYSTTFLAMREGGVQCRWCMESDHKDHECAIADTQPQGPVPSPHPQGSANPGGSRQGYQAQQRKQKTVSRICRAFNFSSCQGPPECQYRHACLRCRRGSHRVADCPDPPPSGEEEGGPPSAKSFRSSK